MVLVYLLNLLTRLLREIPFASTSAEATVKGIVIDKVICPTITAPGIALCTAAITMDVMPNMPVNTPPNAVQKGPVTVPGGFFTYLVIPRSPVFFSVP